MEGQYKVVLKGLKPDAESAQAKQKLATLFKASPEQMERVLAQPNYIVKSGLTADLAAKYQKAIESAGGLCILEPETPAASELDIRLDTPAQPSPPLAPPVTAPTIQPSQRPNSFSRCIHCGANIEGNAKFCPACGASQSPAQPNRVQSGGAQTEETKPPQGEEPYQTYDQVPWFRRNLFAVVCIIFFPLGLLPVLLTGDSYYMRKGEMRKFSKMAKAIIIALGLASLVFIAYALMDNSAPKCSDKGTKNLVLEIVREKLNQVTDASGMQIRLNAIRTLESNDKTGAQMCAAQLHFSGSGKETTLDITYKSEKTDKGGEFFVTVYGL